MGIGCLFDDVSQPTFKTVLIRIAACLNKARLRGCNRLFVMVVSCHFSLMSMMLSLTYGMGVCNSFDHEFDNESNIDQDDDDG